MNVIGISLVGLPGCGISSIRATAQFQAMKATDALSWCVINMSEPLPPSWAAAYLDQCLVRSNAIVFSVVEQADLALQMQWQAWVKEAIVRLALQDLPRVRWQNNGFPARWLADYKHSQKSAKAVLSDLPLPVLETFCFDVGAVNFLHLQFGVDALVQNKSAAIYRVKGRVKATEYSHLIDIEITAQSSRAFPVTDKNHTADAPPYQITVVCQGVKKALIQEVINACNASS